MALALLMGPGGHGACSAGARRLTDPAHNSLAGGRAGSTHKGFFWATLFSRRLLEDTAFCPDNVLGVLSSLWEAAAGVAGSWASLPRVPEGSFLSHPL